MVLKQWGKTGPELRLDHSELIGMLQAGYPNKQEL